MWANELKVWQKGRTSFRDLTSLFLAQPCVVCDRPTLHPFCLDCYRQVLPAPVEASVCPTAEHDRLPVMSLGTYDSALKRAILKLKYSDRPDIARPLGVCLGQQWQAQWSVPDADRRTKLYAIPIPLHTDRQQARGYNQAELIARAFCQVSGLPLLPQGLIRTQATLPMHSLSLPARQQNLVQAFQVGSSLQRAIRPHVLLIDDIYTTGTTVQSAADTLAQAGISVRGVLVVARAML